MKNFKYLIILQAFGFISCQNAANEKVYGNWELQRIVPDSTNMKFENAMAYILVQKDLATNPVFINIKKDSVFFTDSNNKTLDKSSFSISSEKEGTWNCLIGEKQAKLSIDSKNVGTLSTNEQGNAVTFYIKKS